MRQSRGTLRAMQSLEPKYVTTCEERRFLCRSLIVTATKLSGFQTNFNYAGEPLHSYAISELLDKKIKK